MRPRPREVGPRLADPALEGGLSLLALGEHARELGFSRRGDRGLLLSGGGLGSLGVDVGREALGLRLGRADLRVEVADALGTGMSAEPASHDGGGERGEERGAGTPDPPGSALAHRGMSIVDSILLMPTGLAVGLAPKDWRYVADAAIRPRGPAPDSAPHPSGSPAPSGWVPKNSAVKAREILANR